MTADFSVFYENPNYLRHKKYLFNYQLRRRTIGAHLRSCGAPILDVGCGIAPMTPRGPRTFLADLSFAAMAAMRSEGYEAVVLDIARLGVRDESVATAVCSEVLEHIAEDEQALSEISRVLQPGGALILTVPLHQSLWHRDDEIVGHQRRYDPERLTRILHRVNLDVRRVTKVGSLFERYLTLVSMRVFMRLDRSGEEWGAGFTGLFSFLNFMLAQLLRLAAFLTPLRFTSVVLLDCRKVEQA